MRVLLPRAWFCTKVLLLAVAPIACMAAACVPLTGGGEAPDVTVREAWPSNGAAARHAVLLVIRVDGRNVFRRFTPLSTTKALYSLDDTGRYQIRATLFRCADACDGGLAGRRRPHRVATCSVEKDFDGSQELEYKVTVSDDLSRCRVGSDTPS